MKRLLFLLIIMCIVSSLLGEGGMKLEKSDWLHIGMPGATNILLKNGLEVCGTEKDKAELISLSMCSIGILLWETRGTATKEDIELGLISLGISYVLNKTIDIMLKGK